MSGTPIKVGDRVLAMGTTALVVNIDRYWFAVKLLGGPGAGCMVDVQAQNIIKITS